ASVRAQPGESERPFERQRGLLHDERLRERAILSILGGGHIPSETGRVNTMQVVIDDPRLLPIRRKVEARERLSFEDGIALYGTTDILSLGYLANLVRERLHGAVTYFNVNRHINPTDVCVASCRLCAFGKRVRDPKAYTM